MTKLSGIITILTVIISGYIGFTTNYTNTAKAENIPIVRYIETPKPQGFSLNIDLNHNSVVANTQSQGVNVDITKKDSIVYKYITKTVEKPKYIRISEQPPVRKPVVRIPIPDFRASVSSITHQDN